MDPVKCSFFLSENGKSEDFLNNPIESACCLIGDGMDFSKSTTKGQPALISNILFKNGPSGAPCSRIFEQYTNSSGRLTNPLSLSPRTANRPPSEERPQPEIPTDPGRERE
jgi:hypothetical protein